MQPQQMQKLIHESMKAVYRMSDEALLLGLNAGLLDRRYESLIGRDRTQDPVEFRLTHKVTKINRKPNK